MIRKVELNNFKSHKDTKLDFSNLTVLCGANSSGKSSVIQALLLLRERWESRQFDYLNLITDTVTIGTAQDTLYQFSDKDEISFIIKNDTDTSELHFEIKDSTKTFLSRFGEIEDEKIPFDISNYQFISASRFGPLQVYPKDDMVDIFNQISKMGGKSEYVVQFLDKRRYQEVLPDICIANYSTDLFTQVTAWEREISSGVSVIVEDKGQLGYELKYQFSTEKGKTDKFNAINVGFGLSYALPVIVAILSADDTSILFIENPEAHLHPRGQAKLAELLCLAAQAGIQIVVETHSDHIINGILVQCKKYKDASKGIDKNNVSIYHFTMDEEEHCTQEERVKIEEDGRIRYAPEGFFDQFTIDRKQLMGF